MVNITRASQLAEVGVNGGGWTGPIGTASPASPDVQPLSPWSPIGLINDGGLTQSFTESNQEFIAWGQTAPFRTTITKSVRTFKITALETSRVSVQSLQYRIPEGSLAPVSSLTSFAETASPVPDRRAFYFLVMDGTVFRGYYVPQGEITDRSDVVHKTTDIAGYQWTITAYPDSANNTVYHTEIVPATPAYTGS